MSIPRIPSSARILFPAPSPETPVEGAPRQQTRRLANIRPVSPEAASLPDAPLAPPRRNTVRFEIEDLVDDIVERELRMGRIRREAIRRPTQPNMQRARLEVAPPSPEGDEYAELPPLNREPSSSNPEQPPNNQQDN